MSAFRSRRRRLEKPFSVDPFYLARVHAQDLAEAARDILAQVADARLCGVVVAKDADEGVPLRALLWQCRGGSDERSTCIGVVELADLARVLRRDRARASTLAHLCTVPAGTLPVLVASTSGLRATAIAIGSAALATG